MFRRIVLGLSAGFLIGVFGVIVSLTPFGTWLELEVGLQLLFNARGSKPPSPHAVVIALDEESSKDLGLPRNPQKWSRDYFARLTEILNRHHARLIAFDVVFSDPGVEEEDYRFSVAMARAGNVLLSEHLRKETLPIGPAGYVQIEKILPPLDLFSNSATLCAPFPLPKVPFTVSQFWAFKPTGYKPTFPAAALQIYAISAFPDFLEVLKRCCPSCAESVPGDTASLCKQEKLVRVISKLRDMFKEDGLLEIRMAERLRSEFSNLDREKKRELESLIRLYSGPDSLFLNFYGPAGSIPTIPVNRVIKAGALSQDLPELENKAVFIGLAEKQQAEQRDGFHTVFSSSDGADLSGVEIAATAFSNLLENESLGHFPLKIFLLVILLYGVALSTPAFVMPPFASACWLVAGASLYAMFSIFLFSSHNFWIPVGVPVLVQSLAALVGGLIWNYYHSRKEREDFRKAFGLFLPANAVDQIVQDLSATRGLANVRHAVFGTILCTDGEQYAQLAEHMKPEELNHFLNAYYESIFTPVRLNHGIVSDVIGDSMLAVWTGTRPDRSQRLGACRAAFEILGAVESLNVGRERFRMRTRIGIDYGEIMLGTIGGFGHYEYRAVGDVVNTASRLENLNKRFDTKILISGKAMAGIDDFLARELGCFLLAGKRNPVKVYELICPIEDADEIREHLCMIFSAGLREFERRDWDKAAWSFKEYLRIAGTDSAASYYVGQCEILKANPPSQSWEGLVEMTKS